MSKKNLDNQCGPENKDASDAHDGPPSLVTASVPQIQINQDSRDEVGFAAGMERMIDGKVVQIHNGH
jgi:hypothetical protein